jgi:hypothetical protein
VDTGTWVVVGVLTVWVVLSVAAAFLIGPSIHVGMKEERDERARDVGLDDLLDDGPSDGVVPPLPKQRDRETPPRGREASSEGHDA